MKNGASERHLMNVRLMVSEWQRKRESERESFGVRRRLSRQSSE